MEVKIIALDITCIDADRLKDLSKMPLVCKPMPAISVHCDCKSTIDKCKQKN